MDRHAGEGGRAWVLGIRWHRIFVAKILDTKPGDFRAAPAAGSKGDEEQGAVAEINLALAAANSQQLRQDTASDGLLLLRCRGRATARTAILSALFSDGAL
jgi:uncharacterized protein YegL